VIRLVAPALCLALGGCAFYNGIYNAREAGRTADKQARRGEAAAATQSYFLSAAKAETVLARHPDTRWRPTALFLAGRGHAMAGECLRARPRLEEYLAVESEPEELNRRAMVAKAACLVLAGQLLAADSILTPLLESPVPSVRDEAALWGGRAALGLGDADRAQQLLATVPGSVAAWEFMNAAFARGDIVTAESLLTSRAAAGDWRPEVSGHVRSLWGLGRTEGATQVVNYYARSRAAGGNRVSLHLLLSDLAAESGDTSLARRQAHSAQRVGVTATIDAEVQSRLLALRIRELDVLEDVRAAVARDSARAHGSALLRRIQDNLLLMRLCLARVDGVGANVFLAAEIARDSLRSRALSQAMFRSIERDYPESPIAARGLLAAAAIIPESSSVYRSRIVELWPESWSAVSLLEGLPSESTMTQEDRMLRVAWTYAVTQFADTMSARRKADSVTAAAGRGQIQQ